MLEKNVSAADLENPAALLTIRVAAGVEDDAVSGFQRNRQRIKLNMVAAGPKNLSHKGPALFSKPRPDEFLVVDPVHPSAVKAARKRHFEPVLIVGCRLGGLPLHRRINRLAINRRDRCDIFR